MDWLEVVKKVVGGVREFEEGEGVGGRVVGEGVGEEGSEVGERGEVENLR